jgi:hypothetical protein
MCDLIELTFAVFLDQFHQKIKQRLNLHLNKFIYLMEIYQRMMCLVLQQFEEKASDLKHQLCQVCMCTSLCMTVVEHKGKTMCSLCHSRKAYECDQSLTLPVWIDDDGTTQYHLPEELECLREAEKLLIAQVSAYVPLHHLRKGQLGCRGHTCCFTQVRYIISFMM